MYEAFFGLRQKAFSLTSDPNLLFLNERSQDALAGINYAILGRKGLMVLTGEAGTGKSTLLARVLQYLPAKAHVCHILNPTLTASEFLETILLGFGLHDIPQSKALRLQRLSQLLRRNLGDAEVSVLIVDEAHKMPVELLEEIRLLGNLERPEQKLLQVLLAGQPELSDLLNREDLRQFKQRIAVRLRIERLADAEVALYVRCRWMKAGGSEPLPFTPEALALVARCANGIPRLINSICDYSLLLAFADERKEVSADHVQSAAQALELIDFPMPPKSLSLAQPAVGRVSSPSSVPQPAVPLPATQPLVPLPVTIAAFREPPAAIGNSHIANGSVRKSWWNRRTVRIRVGVPSEG